MTARTSGTQPLLRRRRAAVAAAASTVAPPAAGAFETGISGSQGEAAGWIRRATTEADRTGGRPNPSRVVRARATLVEAGSGRSHAHPVADTAAQPR